MHLNMVPVAVHGTYCSHSLWTHITEGDILHNYCIINTQMLWDVHLIYNEMQCIQMHLMLDFTSCQNWTCSISNTRTIICNKIWESFNSLDESFISISLQIVNAWEVNSISDRVFLLHQQTKEIQKEEVGGLRGIPSRRLPNKTRPGYITTKRDLYDLGKLSKAYCISDWEILSRCSLFW